MSGAGSLTGIGGRLPAGVPQQPYPSQPPSQTLSGIARRTIVEEQWANSRMAGFRPQLAGVILGLLHFADYEREEYEPVLDERMVVNSFISLNRAVRQPGYEMSREHL